jgi:hypothetical protein
MKRDSVLVRPLGLATFLALGFGAVWGCATLWSLDIVRNLMREDYVQEDLYIQTDGTPVLATVEYRGWRIAQRSLRTLDGVPVTQWNIVYSSPLAPPPHQRFGGLEWSERLYGFGTGDIPGEFWYFLHDGHEDGHGYFVGYDSQTSALLGYLGKHGLQQTPPSSAEQFPVSGRLLGATLGNVRAINHNGQGFGFEPSPNQSLTGAEPLPDTKAYLISGAELLEINLSKRAVRPLREAGDAISVGTTQKLLPDRAKLEEAKAEEVVVLRAADRLIMMSAERAPREVPLPAAIRSQPLMVFELHDGTVLARVHQLSIDDPDEELYWLGADPAQTRMRVVPVQRSRAPASPRSRWAWFAAGLPAPLPLGGLVVMDPVDQVRWGRAPDYGTGLRDALAAAWPALVVVGVMAAAFAAWAWRWQRLHGGRFPLAWFVFVLLLGWPGLVGYWCHRRWPVRTACPACGRLTPRDRAACLECQRAFPAPAPLGTEVVA